MQVSPLVKDPVKHRQQYYSFGHFKFRLPETIIQNSPDLRHLQPEICLCDHHEATPGDSHWSETLLMQGVRKAIHTEGKPQGESIYFLVPCGTQEVALGYEKSQGY